MVLRSSDVPRTPADRLADHSTQLDEVARAISRGSQALRNDAGHILNLNPESPNPLLVPTGGNNNIDSALKFQDGGLEVRSPDGETFRDFGARGGFFRSRVQGTSYIATAEDGGASFRGPSGTFGGQTINGGGFAGSKFVATADAPGFSGPSATFGGVVINGGGIGAAGKNISTDPNGSMNSLQITCGNLTYGTLTQGSDARLKDVDDDPVELDAAADDLLAAPVRGWAWRQKWAWDDTDEQWVDVTPDHGQHYGIVAQDAPEPLQVTREDGYLALDRATYDGLVLRLLQRQDARIVDLERRLAAFSGPISE